MKNLRKPREKHFLKEDGTMVAYVYTDDIHYLKNGIYEEIDNTLIRKKEKIINTSNAYQASFETLSRGKILSVESLGHHLSMEIKGQKEVCPKIKEKEIAYEEILEGMDALYKMLPTKMKESIVIKDKKYIPKVIEFALDTDLDLTINGKTIEAKDKENVIFTIEEPYMIDGKGEMNENIFYSILKQEKAYKVLLHLDLEWLEQATYPVIIDPTITNNDQNKNVYDTYIYPGDTNVDRNSQNVLKIGVEKVNDVDVVNRALIKFDLPTIGTGDQIIGASMRLIGYPKAIDYNHPIFDIHRITSDWNETTANWKNMANQYDSKIEQSTYITNSTWLEIGTVNPSINTIDITGLVKSWYAGVPNYGLLLKDHVEIYSEDRPVVECFSKNNTVEGADPKPVLIIQYRNQNGLENYMDYQTGTLVDIQSNINLYNGNLVASIELGKTISGKFPINLTAFYNTNDVILNHNYGYGLGWKLNYHQTIVENTIGNLSVLEYLDEDGTTHYFYKGSDYNNEVDETAEDTIIREENTYYDEDGLSLTIVLENNQYIMKDSNGNQSTFTKIGNIWYLTKIKDTNGFVNTIEYEKNRIKKITDANGSVIQITYVPGSQNKILSITSPKGLSLLSWEGELLKQITIFTKKIKITYNRYQLIENIQDITGKSLGYEYYETNPYRVKKITEYGTDKVEGNTVTLQYGWNTTTLTDEKNNHQTYTFNNTGNTIGLTNLDSQETIKTAYGKRYQYGSKNQLTNSTGSVNKLTIERPNIQIHKNYLENTSFEEEQVVFQVGTNTSTNRIVNMAFTGKYALEVIGGNNEENPMIYKEVSIPKGNYYTFSAYIQSDGGKLGLFYRDSNGNNKEEIVEIPPSSVYYRNEVSIYYPVDATTPLTIQIQIDPNKKMYIDDIQLEEGYVANLYNMVMNSDFSKGIEGWTVYTYPSLLGHGNLDQPYEVITYQNGSTALKLHGDPYYTESLTKKIPIQGKKNDIYTVYFWYKNDGINADLGPTSGKRVLIRFEYVEHDDPHGLIPRGEYGTSSEWQFFEESFMAEYDYTAIYITIDNSFNANDLYVTNFALYNPIAGSGFIYDEIGNIKTYNDPFSETTEFQYDKNNQLINMMDIKGTSFTYEYDNKVKDRVLSGTSSTGITNKIQYDNFGNPIMTQVYNKRPNKELQEYMYEVRKKGTEAYWNPDFITKNIKIKPDLCSHYAWKLEKEGEYYKIISVENPYYSLRNYNHTVRLNRNGYSLFSFMQNKNGSYSIKEKDTNTYITIREDSLILQELESDNENQQFFLEEKLSKQFIENKATYTEDGKFIASTTDTLGRTTFYDINPENELINSVTDPKGNMTNYTYNSNEQITKVKNKDKEVTYDYNTNHLLTGIHHGTKHYKLTYDNFLNTKEIKINNQNLITNEYEENNGNLLHSTYGNGNQISYEYDEFNRIKKIHKKNQSYSYFYDNLGNIAKIDSNNEKYRYYYDISNRLIEYHYQPFKIRYTYGIGSKVTDKYFTKDEHNKHIHYEYNDDDFITKINFITENIPLEYNYIYDELGRVKENNINNTHKVKYKYTTKGYRTSYQLHQLTLGNDIYTYEYDLLNNITDIYKNGEKTNHYEYDDYNELIKDDDYRRNITTIYTYDNVGNITSKKEYSLHTENLIKEEFYEYGNSNWQDQLTKFNNESITYDEIGNPLTIGNKTLTWTNGRTLNKYQDANVDICYTYNVDGIRTKKQVGNEITNYYVENDHILFEEMGNNVIYYIRDDDDDVIGLSYNGIIYYYLKNAQNDIIGILNGNFEKVAQYQYNAYGEILAIQDANGIEITDTQHIAHINPFRYRSYYYDKETNLYYLNSRYYNPVWGRFLNADSIILPSKYFSYNLYLYTSNNPINFSDMSGQFLKKIGNKLKKGIKAVGDFLGKIFGGEVTQTVSVEYTPTVKAGNGIISASSKSSCSKVVTKYGDANKPISGYVNLHNGNILESGAGINLNVFSLRINMNIGASDFSLNVGYFSDNNKKVLNSSGIGISLTEFTAFGRFNQDAEVGEDYTINTQARVDVNLTVPIAIYTAGQVRLPSTNPFVRVPLPNFAG